MTETTGSELTPDQAQATNTPDNLANPTTVDAPSGADEVAAVSSPVTPTFVAPTESPSAAPEVTADEHEHASVSPPPIAVSEPGPTPTVAKFGDSAADAEPEVSEPVPASWDEFEMPASLRSAIDTLGWTKPTPVQGRTFATMVAGTDVLVQSQTGSGKTGAFCLPWLASRFQPGPARETGVQLIVLLPTRELAKQVCDELQRLAIDTPVDVLPVYGGTAMAPQLDTLAAGVHAVVGTPGRILDHIRRRSLDLSKVRSVVLDECDEMLSMGFVEDIRSILSACPDDRQTCLFSATVPREIERISRRHMRDPVRITLSGDEIAAAEIDHAFYSTGANIKTRDLLDVVMLEDPSSAIVFCNTREETRIVASVLQKQGYSAEALSSDLTQTAREKVMGKFRDRQLRFLVATDVAARGIDVSHVSHVLNFSFPENPEVYVHRTGRTGRAGRAGVALSIVSPLEIGSFYTLTKTYKTIQFTERKLPPKDELAATRTEVKLDQISRDYSEPVSPEWVLLARRLAEDPRGERVVAYLLHEAIESERLAKRRAETDGDDAESVERQEMRERNSDRDDRRGHERGPSRDRDRGRSRGGRDGDRDRSRGGDRDRGPRTGDRDRDRDRSGQAHVSERAVRAPDTELELPTEAVVSPAPEADEDRPRRRRRERRDRDERSTTGPSGTELHEPGSTTPSMVVSDDRSASPAEQPLAARTTDAPRDVGDTSEDEADTDTSGEVDSESDSESDAESDVESDAGQEGDDRPKKRRRRRRRRKPSSEESGELTADGQAREGSAATQDVAAEGDGGADSDDEDTDAEGEPGAEGEDGKKRRRRRRRRGRGPAATSAAPAAEAQQPAAAADGGGKKKRRRRRRRGQDGDGDNDSRDDDEAELAPMEETPRVSQDEIIIDIDEQELSMVRDEFGEIDELDDLTLKGRRRAVLDDLTEEMEVEDLTDSDAEDDYGDAEDEGEGEGESDAENDFEARREPRTGTESSDDDSPATNADGSPATGDELDSDGHKKKRRRRRKKKAPAAAPELTCPPHKDFWEVWASKFSAADFQRDEDARDNEEVVEDEPIVLSHASSAAPAAVDADLDSDVDLIEDAPDEDSLGRVALNIGRGHGHKAAHVRALLRRVTGLHGKAVKDLTVRDQTSLFRMDIRHFETVVARLDGSVVGDVTLTLVQLSEAADGDDGEVPALRVPEPTKAAPPAGSPEPAPEPAEAKPEVAETDIEAPATAARPPTTARLAASTVDTVATVDTNDAAPAPAPSDSVSAADKPVDQTLAEVAAAPDEV